jgi:uncharacterized protein (TIGR03083 family)
MLRELEPFADQFKTVRRELRDAVAGLSPEQLRAPFPRGDWSIRDALAHLAANESLMTDVLQSMAAGAPSPLSADFDNDRFNAETVAKAKSLSVDQVWGELEESRSKLFRVLESLAPQQLEQCGTHPLQGELTVKEFLVAMYAHETIHTREIVEQARRLRRGGGPA